MSLLYTLGWPGMLNLPCVIVDQVTREVYNPDHKLPLSKIHLNTTNNKYVELAAILKLFPPGKDKDAMHSFMSISSDFGMRKFFMDRHQRAYISLDTLLVYLIVYPYCPEFVTARAQIAKYLQTFREIPCLKCGFINRDCVCYQRGHSHPTSFDLVGFATDLMDRETQTIEAPSLPGPLPHPTLLPQPTSLQPMNGMGPPTGMVNTQGNKGPMQSILNVNPTSSVATVNPTPLTSSAKDKQTNKVTPINIVTPMRTRPIMCDASCQTRANFDFSMKKRDKISWENKNKDIVAGLETAAKDDTSSKDSDVNSSLTNTPGASNTPLIVHSQPINLVSKQPVKVSLWKLLDSDSSSDEDESGTKKNKKESNKNDVDKFKAPLPKSLDFSNEKMETNSTENLTEEEKLLLEEAKKLTPESKSEDVDNKTKSSSLFSDNTSENSQINPDSNLTVDKNRSSENLSDNEDNVDDSSVEISMFQALGEENKTKNSQNKPKTSEKEIGKAVENNNFENRSITPAAKDIATLCQEAAAKVISEATISKLEARMVGKPVGSDSSKANDSSADSSPTKESKSEIISKESNIKLLSTDVEVVAEPEVNESSTSNGVSTMESAGVDKDVSKEVESSEDQKETTTVTNEKMDTDETENTPDKQDETTEENKEQNKAADSADVTTEVSADVQSPKETVVTDNIDKGESTSTVTDKEENQDQEDKHLTKPADEAKDQSPSKLTDKAEKQTDESNNLNLTKLTDKEEKPTDESDDQSLIKLTNQEEKPTDESKDQSSTKLTDKDKTQDKEKATDGDEDEDKPLVINEAEEGDKKTDADNEATSTENKADQDKKTPEESSEQPVEKSSTEGASAESKSKKEAKKEKKPFLNYKKWCHRFEYTPTGEKLYRCTFSRCGQCFDTKNSAAMHNRVHGTFGRESSFALQCYKCDYNTGLNKWFDMVRHLKFSHDELISLAEYGCFLCGREFPDQESMTRHIDFHYSGRYKCVHCGNILFTWKQVEDHIKESCENKDKKEKNLGCPYCPLVFHIRNMRNAHMLSHQDKGLVCTFCDNEDLWENWKLLRKHYQQKHGERIRASLNPLKKVNPNKPALDPKKEPALKPAHKTKIDIKKNPVCHVCDEEFTVMEDFEYHMRKKHDFVPYVLSVCDMCEKTFKTMKMYEWHMRNTHADDIKCDQCDFVAKTQLMLKVHIQNQHTTKEHSCTECGKEFEHYHQLRMHMARHAMHTIYCCQICGEEFKRQKELRHHTSTAHPKNTDQPQQTCPDCDYSCFTRRAMDAHIKKYHPRLAEEIEESEQQNSGLQPEHSYFTTNFRTPAVPLPTIPAPKPPRPKPVTPEGEGGGSLVIRLPKNIGKKYKKGKKRRYSTTKEDEPREVSEEVLEKRRVKRERKENMERLKILSRETCARSRTYEDFRAMKELFKHKELQQQASITQPDQEQEWVPDPKRARVSKYGRSITTKTLDDSFVPSVKFVNDVAKEPPTPSEVQQYKIEKQKRADAIKRRRVSVGLYGVAPPEMWGDEDIHVDYPYSDHCYFTIEHAQTIPSQPSSVSISLSDRRYSGSSSMSYDEPPALIGTPGSFRQGGMMQNPMSDFDDIAAQNDMQTIRIGPGGIVKKSKNRKQKIQYRTGIDFSPPGTSRGSGFMPLMPQGGNYGQQQIITQGVGMDLQYGQSGQDIQEEIIEQDLIREVTEIAQKDPVLQEMINSMQQTAGQGGNVVIPSSPQPNSASNLLLNQGADGFQNMPQGSSTFVNMNTSNVMDSYQGNVLSRHVTPPRSLNIPSSVTGSEMMSSSLATGSSSGATPTKQLAGVAQGSGMGLTPTKQNVLDFILSKAGTSTELEDIDLNEDELKLLLNEHNRSIEQTQDGVVGDESQDSMVEGSRLIEPNNQVGDQQVESTGSETMNDMAHEILESASESQEQKVADISKQQSDVIEEQSNVVVEQQTDLLVEESNVVEQDTEVDIEGQIEEEPTDVLQNEETVVEEEIVSIDNVDVEQEQQIETLENPDIMSVTPFSNQQQQVLNEDPAISVESHQYPDTSDISNSENQKIYKVIYQQPDGQSVVQTVTGDGLNVQLDNDQQITEIPQMSPQISHMSPQISQPQVLVSSAYDQHSLIQSNQNIIYTTGQQGHEAVQDSSGISALIAASEVSEQEQQDAVANLLSDNQTMEQSQIVEQTTSASEVAGQIVHKQIQYVNELGELISVQIAEPQGASGIEQHEPQQDPGIQLEEQLITTEQVQTISSNVGNILTVGEPSSSGTRRLIRTMGVAGGSNPITQHTIVKQVLQEPATVPVSSQQQPFQQQQQYRTVQIGHKPRQLLNTSTSSGSVQYIQGNQGRSVSLLGNQPTQRTVVRQISSRGRGRVINPYQRVQQPMHRVVRLSSPNQMVQNQNQTKIIKLPSAAVATSNQQQQSIGSSGGNQGQLTGRIVSIAGGQGGQGQRIVRVVQRPNRPQPTIRGVGRPPSTAIRPAFGQSRVVQRGLPYTPGVRIRAPVSTPAQSAVTMVRLESDGQGGQRMVQVTDPNEMQ